MPAAIVSRVTQAHLGLYVAHAAEEESALARKHKAAMFCRDVEDCMAFGVTVYRQLTELDTQVRLQWARGERKASKRDVASLERAFALWLKASDQLHKCVTWCEAAFGDLDHGQEWLECYREAKSAAEEEELAPSS